MAAKKKKTAPKKKAAKKTAKKAAKQAPRKAAKKAAKKAPKKAAKKAPQATPAAAKRAKQAPPAAPTPAKPAEPAKAPAVDSYGTMKKMQPAQSVSKPKAYQAAPPEHHAVSARQMEAVASEGLRSDGEILQVEEADVAPCRLVDHGEGRFSLCFDDFRMPRVPLFEERGLQGGGYTWEAVVAALVKMRRPDLETQVGYDSEAGMFVALGTRDQLRAVAKLIQMALKDPALLRAGVENADPDRLE